MDITVLTATGLIDTNGALVDQGARRIFLRVEQRWNHPIATYMARLAPSTRKGI